MIAAFEFKLDDQQIRLVKLRNPWGEGEWKGDWSDSSPLWNDALKKKFGVEVGDDGEFHMSFEDYLKEYRSTSLSVEYNQQKFKHSNLLHDFTADKFAFFSFTLKKDINLNEMVFSVDLSQQGDRLGSYR